MDIKTVCKVNRMRSVTYPDEWKLMAKTEKVSDVPSTFFNGSKWFVYFNCCSCRQEVEYKSYYGSPDYILGGSLHFDTFSNKEYLRLIGSLFDLDVIDEGVDKNEKTIFYFVEKNHLARFNYSKCQQCHSQYLMVYSLEFGNERPPQPDLVHLKGIYHVEFDEVEFFKLYEKYKVGAK